MRLAIGTSLAIITATSALALTTHLLAGPGLDIPVTLAMNAACLLGAVADTIMADGVPQANSGTGSRQAVPAVAGYPMISDAFRGGPPGA